MDGNIDCDALISAIKSQELIWNYKLDDHSDKIKKNNAWAAVCEQLIENFKEKPVADKNKIATSLQKKWKVLRDGYSRYAKKIKPKSGSAATKIRPYPYYEQLLFLKVTEARPEKSDSLKEISEDNDHNKESEIRRTSTFKRKLTNKTEDELIEKLSKRIDEKPSSKLPIEDEDKMFLLSLAGEFKHIKDQYKLDARSEIINVIKYFKGISQTQSSYYGESRGYFTPLTNEQRGYNCTSYNKGYQSASSTSTSDQRFASVSANDEFSQSSFEDRFPPSSVLSDDIITDIFNE